VGGGQACKPDPHVPDIGPKITCENVNRDKKVLRFMPVNNDASKQLIRYEYSLSNFRDSLATLFSKSIIRLKNPTIVISESANKNERNRHVI